MVKLLILGLGSIGIRHAQILYDFGRVEIAAYRTRKGIKKIPGDLENRIKYFFNEDDAFSWKPDFLIVSNPTKFHLKYLLKSIDYEIDALIEKPLMMNYNDIKPIEEKIKKRKNSIYVAYNLRFHPIASKVKEIIDSNKYGKVLKAESYVGEYLPFWHLYEDYRISYAAKKELGGGVLRTLSHEIDLGQYWFGDYYKIFADISKISNLDIDVDDSVDILAKMKGGENVRISMDYLNPSKEREGKIFFEKGMLKYDLLRNQIEFTDYLTKKNKSVIKIRNLGKNATYKSQLNSFINKHKGELCSLEKGINVMKIIKTCEESNLKGKSLVV